MASYRHTRFFRCSALAQVCDAGMSEVMITRLYVGPLPPAVNTYSRRWSILEDQTLASYGLGGFKRHSYLYLPRLPQGQILCMGFYAVSYFMEQVQDVKAKRGYEVMERRLLGKRPPLFVVISKTVISSMVLYIRGFVSLGVTLLTPLVKTVHCGFNRGGAKAELPPEVASTAGKNVSKLKRGTFCLGNAPPSSFTSNMVLFNKGFVSPAVPYCSYLWSVKIEHRGLFGFSIATSPGEGGQISGNLTR